MRGALTHDTVEFQALLSAQDVKAEGVARGHQANPQHGAAALVCGLAVDRYQEIPRLQARVRCRAAGIHIAHNEATTFPLSKAQSCRHALH